MRLGERSDHGRVTTSTREEPVASHRVSWVRLDIERAALRHNDFSWEMTRCRKGACVSRERDEQATPHVGRRCTHQTASCGSPCRGRSCDRSTVSFGLSQNLRNERSISSPMLGLTVRAGCRSPRPCPQGSSFHSLAGQDSDVPKCRGDH